MKPSRKTNTRLVAAASALILLSLTATVVPEWTSEGSGPNIPETATTTSTAVGTVPEMDQMDFGNLVVKYSNDSVVSLDRAVPAPTSGYSLDDSLPSRPAPIESDPFNYGRTDEAPLTGLTEAEHVFSEIELHGDGSLQCQQAWTINRVPREFDTDQTWISGCTVIHSPRGDFMAVARNASLNNLLLSQMAALVIEIYVQRTLSDGKSWAVEVLNAYIPNSLCDRRFTSVSKASAGDSEVLVIEDNLGQVSRVTLVAANEEGMPTTIASYALDGWDAAFGYRSTDRSFVVDSPRGYKNGRTLHEIFMSPAGWRERTHVSISESDPLSQFTSQSDGAPVVIVQLGFPSYSNGDDWCGRFGQNPEFGY
jgi:hypothetical protein